MNTLWQTETNIWIGGGNVTLDMTNSYLGSGTANWTSQPAGISGSGSSITFSPSTLTAGTYTVTAQSSVLPECYDTCTVRVIKVNIIQTNLAGYIYCTNCAVFNLTADSWTNVTWSILPDLGTNGTQFTAGQTWAGTGTNRWQGRSVWVYAGPVSNNYTIRASAVEATNCTDTAVFEVLKPSFLDLNWLETTNETLHHTSAYQTNALVLRRSDKFKVEAKLSKGYTNTCFNVWFQAVHNFDGAPKTNDVPEVANDLGATDWYCKLLAVSNHADQTKTVQLEINIPSTNCPIGEYQWRAVVSPKAATNIFLDTANFPGQVIILFNPWSANDSVYMANDNERTEYVMETAGIIWRGSPDRYNKTTKAWTYGQFDTVSISVLLSELFSQDSVQRVNPIFISRHLSARVNSNGGGILWGLWPADGVFPADGTPADYWTGSKKILTQYQSNSVPVKYGQCWVFAGLLTTMLRCSGIPARPITNYESAHDTNGNQIVELRGWNGVTYDESRSEKIWNFHVWCDAWMKRSDQTGQDGWQAVDATPQELSGGTYQCEVAPD